MEIKTKPITAVFIDRHGNTSYTSKPTGALSSLCSEFKIKPWDILEPAVIIKDNVEDEVVKLLAELSKKSLVETRRLLNKIDFFNRSMQEHKSLRLFEDVLVFMKLMQTYYPDTKIYILSDMNKSWAAPSENEKILWDMIGIENIFHSYMIGGTKNNPETYLKVCEITGHNPAQCIMIGDNAHRDHDVALEAGFADAIIMNHEELRGMPMLVPTHTETEIKELKKSGAKIANNWIDIFNMLELGYEPTENKECDNFFDNNPMLIIEG